ncbi:protein translocase subunit SecD [bacterium]|nr:protein translocase subunit SecD [bacterium]
MNFFWPWLVLIVGVFILWILAQNTVSSDLRPRITGWMIIIEVLLIALWQPGYRAFDIDSPIIKLGLDLQGGANVLLQAHAEGRSPTDDEMNGVIEVIRNRVDPQGLKEIALQRVGEDRVSLQVPGEDDPDTLAKLIGETALLEFIDTGRDSFERGTDLSKEIESGEYTVILKGDDLKSAEFAIAQGNPIVRFEFKPSAGKVFGTFTSENIGRFLTVTLDKTVVTSPTIKGAIWGGSGIIEGGFTIDSADLLARQLNAGRLPVPVEIIENRVIGPILGKESIDTSIRAGLIGFVIILLFMAIFYKLPGLLSCLALVLYVVLVLGYLSLFDATLTLPGIAGFLLSIGMAVDANIIIFERLKEELAWGKTLSASVESAFARAWVAIFDANLTTLIGTAVLYFYGSGPIKGFAVTLSLGILLSFFSAVFVTRFFLTQISVKLRNTSLYA